MSLNYCRLCQTSTPNMVNLDAGFKKSLENAGVANPAPDALCNNCFGLWKRKISSGAKVIAEKEARKHLASDLWRNRLQFVREARKLFNNNMYAESAASYEKYLKVLEVAFNTKVAGMKPSHFVEKPKEVGLLCSVFWDLMVIYDADPAFHSKQMALSKKLSEFCRYSKVYSSLVRKAELKFWKAKNPDAFRLFLDANNVRIGRCFIANAIFDSPEERTILLLCDFRDKVLLNHFLGKKLVGFYYRFSPYWAEKLSRVFWLKKPAQFILRGVGNALAHIFNLQPHR